MNSEEKLLLIFEDNISTAQQITDISGRGVGMTAVRTAVEKAKGTILVDSRPGIGTRIKISIEDPAVRLGGVHEGLPVAG